ncbi:MAG: hypothetical protein NTV25_09715 [Methanothrix sp.]|nr:hypothetical protein [Methanothrix sp.]
MDQSEAFEQGGSLSTGMDFGSKSLKEIHPFGKYEVEIELTANRRFIGITSISLNKKFLSLEQDLNSIGYIDLDKYYSGDVE